MTLWFAKYRDSYRAHIPKCVCSRWNVQYLPARLYQLSPTLVLVWPGAMKVKTTLIETLVYQLSSTHIFVWPGATKVKTTLMYIQTLVYNNCHRRSSSFNQKKVQSQDNSHTNTCLPTLILIWPGAKSQSQDNSHTNSFFTNCHRLSSSSDQEQRAEVKTTLIQTLCLPTLIGSHPRLTGIKDGRNNPMYKVVIIVYLTYFCISYSIALSLFTIRFFFFTNVILMDGIFPIL